MAVLQDRVAEVKGIKWRDGDGLDVGQGSGFDFESDEQTRLLRKRTHFGA
jgi:hypothetical protein